MGMGGGGVGVAVGMSTERGTNTIPADHAVMYPLPIPHGNVTSGKGTHDGPTSLYFPRRGNPLFCKACVVRSSILGAYPEYAPSLNDPLGSQLGLGEGEKLGRGSRCQGKVFAYQAL